MESRAMLAQREPKQRRTFPDTRPGNEATEAHYLMCPPRHFAVSYSINPWMDPEAWASDSATLGAVARQQWATLYEALLGQGAAIECVEPAPDLPDLVFTANAAVVLDRKALLARFRCPERSGEEPIFGAALQAHTEIDTVVQMPAGVWLEGAGDCIFDPRRRHFWMGFGPRSHRKAAHIVSEVFGVECVALELADPRFYHLDTAFCPLPTDDLIYYPGAFTAAARRLIEERVSAEQRLAIDHADAAEFAANAVPVNGSVVLSGCSHRLMRELEERGFTVIVTPLHAFMRSGGSACCLTLRLDHGTRP